jgi:ElaB/YqjD/DUF883 family membrane-anchored ribosome-binding protein
MTNTMSGAASRAHSMVDDVAQKATPAVQTATAAAHQTIDKVATASATAADWLAANSKQLADKSVAIADAASGQVRARPLISVGGALVLGYFIGRVFR